MADIPAAIKFKGRPIATFYPSSTVGFSVVGTKTVVLTDHPGLYIHDTGGLFGQEKGFSLEDKALSEGLTLIQREDGQVLSFGARFDSTHSCRLQLQGAQAKSVEKQLLRKAIQSPPELLFDSLIHYPITCLFVDPLFEETGEYKEHTLQDPVLCHYSIQGNVAARIALTNTRLHIFTELFGETETMLDLPLHSLRWTKQAKGVLKFTGDSQVRGCSIDSFSINFCKHHDLVEQFEAKIRKYQKTQTSELQPVKGATATAMVTDLLQTKAKAKCDLILAEDTLQIFDASMGILLHSFDLTSEDLSIVGTNRSFVISDAPESIFKVEPSYESFKEKLQNHPQIKKVATKTQSEGAYLVEGQIGEQTGHWRIEDRERAFYFFGRNAPVPLHSHEINALTLETIEEQPQLCIRSSHDTLYLSANYATLEAISLKLRSSQLSTLSNEQALPLLNRIITLEGEYIQHSLFSGILALHELLLHTFKAEKQLAADNRQCSLLPLAHNQTEQLEFITQLISGLPPLREFVEDAILYFPRFLLSCDEALLAQCGISFRLEQMEPVYQRALGSLNHILSQLGRIESELRQFSSLRNALARQKTSWAATAVSLGASVVNPMFLIGAVSGVMNNANAEAMKESSAKENLESAATQCAVHWNRLVSKLLPPAIYRVISAIYPLRVQIAERLKQSLNTTDQAETTAQAVKSRLATLENFLQFPENTPNPKPRFQHVRQLQSLMQNAEVNHYRTF